MLFHYPARPRPEPPLPLLSPPPSITFILSPSTPSHRPHPPPPSFPSATGQESNILQLSPLQLFRFSPSFFIKLPKRQSVADVVPSQPVQLSCPTIACGAQLAAPLPLPVAACSPPFSLSPVSRCGPSTSSEAIGKQRPEMNYPVSSPSLTNK